MATFFGITAAGANTLFGSTSGLYSNSTTTDSPLSTYMSIRNGSYAKLVKSYYSETGKDSEFKNSIRTATDTTKTLASIESASDDLKEAADKLFTNGKESVFAKDSEGNYDTDKIYKAVKDFADAYNDVIEEAGNSNTTDILKRATSMVRDTDTYEKLLGKVGIEVGSDNKLTIDEESFKKADMTTAKSIFNGINSYAYSTSANAAYINYTAEYQASKANTYNAFGSFSYNYSNGGIFNGLS